MFAKNLCLFSFLSVLLTAVSAKAEDVHALLIGVTDYEHFPPKQDLIGPAQDVEIFRGLLRDKFKVSDERMVVLAQSEGAESHPTRANIVREYEALASPDRVKQGDHVVILHSGHGSQDVDDDPDNEADPEVDGLDELFLPADAKNWNSEIGKVENAIRDDEVRQWLSAIRKNGASVFFVSDSCNSESATRGPGNGQHRSRKLDLLPKRVLDSVDRRKSKSRGGPNSGDSRESISQTGMVAFYAARSGQPTPDEFRDPLTGEKNEMGLLVYTINRILRGTEQAITYRELGQRIESEYNRYRVAPSGGRYQSTGVNVPYPAIEGPDLDREVLGNTWRQGRSSISYAKMQNRLYLTCNRLDGTMPGTILKLFPEAGERNADQFIGWAKIIETTLKESVAIAVEYSKESEEWIEIADLEALLPRGRCEIHSHNYGPLRVRLVLDQSADIPAVRQAIEKLSTGDTHYLDVQETGPAPFRLLVKSSPALHVPVDVLVLERIEEHNGVPIVSRFDLGPVDDQLESRFATACKTILKVLSLKEAASEMMLQSADFGGNNKLHVEVIAEVLETEHSNEGTPIDDQTVPTDKYVRFRFANQSGQKVRLNAFYLGDDFTILKVFPEDSTRQFLSGDEGNRLSKFEKTFKVKNATRAIENLVVIVSAEEDKSNQNPFEFVSQNPLRAMWLSDYRGAGRDIQGKSRGQEKGNVRKPGSPLARYMNSKLFQPGATRSGFGDTVVPSCAMSMISWQVVDPKQASAATSNLRQRFDASNLQRSDDTSQPSVAKGRSRGAGDSVYPKVAPAVVVVQTETGHGTGFFISEDGWLLTNHHVVNDCEFDPTTGTRTASISYGQLDGDWMSLADEPLITDIYRWSEEKDLALLKIRDLPPQTGRVPYLELAAKAAIPGSDCVAIGHPAWGVLWTLRTGEVAGRGQWPLDRVEAAVAQISLTASDREEMKRELRESSQQQVLLSTCGINPGDSGGPLVNELGEVIAVSFATPAIDAESGRNFDKWSYHVDLSEVKAFTQNLPDQPMGWEPAFWTNFERCQLSDFDSNGRDDLLVIETSTGGSGTRAMLFDFDENSTLRSFEGDPTPGSIKQQWDAEFAYETGSSKSVYYDTGDDGEFDLYLSDSDGDGFANFQATLVGDSWVSKALSDESISLLDGQHFDSAVSARVLAAFTETSRILRSEVTKGPSSASQQSTPGQLQDSPIGGAAPFPPAPEPESSGQPPLNKLGGASND